jgi:hypothetical protein
MPAKLQFQFAGVDLHRPSSPHRRWLRNGLIVLGSLLAGFCYWEYISHISHRHITPVKIVSAAPVVATKTAPATDVKKTVAEVAAPAVPQTVSAPAPTATATPTVSVEAKPVAAPVAAPLVVSVPHPYKIIATPVHRVYRQHTDAEKMQIAAEEAFGNVLTVANKYPDSYGFNAEDFLSDAKLGAAIPVYTIPETERANYKSGQPVNPLLKSSNQWVYPVLLGDRVCYMILVKKSGKEYVAGTGSKSLAMAWNKILERWPAEAGYHPQIVVNPEIPGYYFTVPELAEPNMTDTVQMTFINPSTSPADVILASWR